MDLIEVMDSRRSVRSYTPRQVDEATVRSLLHAAVKAPSAMNKQPYLFAIVQDAAQLKRYSEKAKTLLLARTVTDAKTSQYADRFRDPAFNIFYDASTLVVIGVAERGTYTDADCWLAAENLLLAACAAGLGSCCIGFAIPMLNLPDTKAELGLPPEGAAVASIIVGYPAVTAPPVPRHPPKVVSWTR